MRKLTHNGARVWVHKEEAHEAQAVVIVSLVRRKEQIARECRHRGNDRILQDDRAALSDLNAFVDVPRRDPCRR